MEDEKWKKIERDKKEEFGGGGRMGRAEELGRKEIGPFDTTRKAMIGQIKEET